MEGSFRTAEPADTGPTTAPGVVAIAAPPVAKLPPAPAPPAKPAPLEVAGFAPASHVGPSGEERWPRPIVVVLHGNFDRPEWECDVWAEAASFHGFLLCPRGVRTPWATLAEDRWTYKGAARVAAEIEAGIGALEARYPGRVTRDGMTLAGFSLGAILAPALVESSPGKYNYVFLVEGGVEKLDEKRVASLRRAGVAGLGLAMSAPGRRRLASALLPLLRSTGIRAIFVDMKGSGHGYGEDFGTTGAAAMRTLVGDAVGGTGGRP
jgi:hypothetical protein